VTVSQILGDGVDAVCSFVVRIVFEEDERNGSPRE
jgi:hypothetical protein